MFLVISLNELAKKDKKIILLVGDIGYRVQCVDEYREKFFLIRFFY